MGLRIGVKGGSGYYKAWGRGARPPRLRGREAAGDGPSPFRRRRRLLVLRTRPASSRDPSSALEGTTTAAEARPLLDGPRSTRPRTQATTTRTATLCAPGCLSSASCRCPFATFGVASRSRTNYARAERPTPARRGRG